MFKNNNEPPESRVNLITKESYFEGVMNLNSNLRIDGYFKGTINSSSIIVVGELGTLDGNINCDEISVYGKLKGTVLTSLIKINKDSSVDANISYENISIQEGSDVKGLLNVITNKTKPVDVST